MDIQTQPKLSFLGVDIMDLHFTSTGSRTGDMEIEIDCDPKVFYPDGDDSIFNILMGIKMRDKDFFNLSLKAVGTFKVEDADGDMRRDFVNANAPAIMFPYIRAFVSTLTSNMGNTVGTLIIPTQFFRGEVEEIKKEED